MISHPLLLLVLGVGPLGSMIPFNALSENAVEPLRPETFFAPPEDLLELFREKRYHIVPAPDATPGHPQLFYALAPYSVTVLQSFDLAVRIQHPTLSLMLSKSSLSFSYLVVHSVPSTLSSKNEFCNHWNFRFRLATCSVDEAGRYHLYHELRFVQDQPAMNLLVLQEAMKYFERSLQLFTKKVVEQPHRAVGASDHGSEL